MRRSSTRSRRRRRRSRRSHRTATDRFLRLSHRSEPPPAAAWLSERPLVVVSHVVGLALHHPRDRRKPSLNLMLATGRTDRQVRRAQPWTRSRAGACATGRPPARAWAGARAGSRAWERARERARAGPRERARAGPRERARAGPRARSRQALAQVCARPRPRRARPQLHRARPLTGRRRRHRREATPRPQRPPRARARLDPRHAASPARTHTRHPHPRA